MKPVSAGVRRVVAAGGTVASIRPETCEDSGLSHDGKNSPHDSTVAAMPWPTDWPWPSHVQVVTASGMFFFSSIQ